jgi:hypothetical protein
MLLAVVLSVLLVSVVGAQAQTQNDALAIKRAADLRQSPSESSSSLGTLPLQTVVTRLTERSGAWVQVRNNAGIVGWIHMFDAAAVGAPPTSASGTASGALRGLTNFLNRGSAQANTTTATSTVGIRGLTGEEIANAQPNMAALAQAEGLRQDAAQAHRFAAAAGLVARAVDPLPAPPSASTTKAQDFQP